MDIGTSEAPTTISDDALRLAAATKRVTLEPISTEVKAEALSDTQIAAQHVNAGALANTPIDSEHTTPPTATASPMTSARSGHVLALTLTAVVLACAGGLLYFILQTR